MNPSRTLLPVALLILILGHGSAALACDMADQVRLLPLGGAGATLVLLELDQYRDSRGLGSQVTWSVSPRLVTRAADGSRAVLNVYDRVEVPERGYTAALAAVFERALTDARAQPEGFTPAAFERHVDCYHLDRCAGSSLGAAGEQLTATVEDGGRLVRAALTYPERLAEHVNARTHMASPRDWRLASIRLFRVAGSRYAMLGVGTGTDADPCTFAADPACRDDREVTSRPLTADVKASLYHQPALHHGAHWDAVVALR